MDALSYDEFIESFESLHVKWRNACDEIKLDNLKKLKSMRERVNDWSMEEERRQFLREIDPVISEQRSGRLPDPRDIFEPEEIDRLLLDAIDCRRLCEHNFLGERFIGYVARSGYKDDHHHRRLRVDDGGKPILCRTTAIHRAARGRFYDLRGVVDDLFKIYDRYDLNYIDAESGLTHFHVACQYGSKEVVAKFLELGQVDPNYHSTSVDPPLHLAMRHENVEAFELLLRRGARPDSTDAEGLTPLHLIKCSTRYFLMTKMLFEICRESNRPVEVDAHRDREGNTPLHRALDDDYGKWIRLLLRRGASPQAVNAEGSTCLHVICKRDDDDYCVRGARRFFKHCDKLNKKVLLDARDNEGRTPLHCSVASGDEGMTELLIRRGSDPNLADAQGSTALHLIVRRGRRHHNCDWLKRVFVICDEQEVCRVLRVDARDNEGRTPLQLAVARLWPDAVLALLARGADPAATFRMPAESEFDECLVSYTSSASSRDELRYRVTSDVLGIVRLLKTKGYELSASDATTFMNLFAKLGLFNDDNDDDDDDDDQHRWYDKDEEFVALAARIMVQPGLSLLGLLRLSPDEAAQRLTYGLFAITRRLYVSPLTSSPDRERRRLPQRCDAEMCAILLRGFCRSWALLSLRELLPPKSPARCCESIAERLETEDLWRLCVATNGRRRC
ncbi:unnamed protein product [Trichogramma brassicae]|uniref:Uncharacterized protein n=1 Tax=Trichogramma brassicae TaxID=86971 RepID=A0A6H5J5K6_9HYME|nr:unnamed protein product [Trichogramma brassicae]